MEFSLLYYTFFLTFTESKVTKFFSLLHARLPVVSSGVGLCMFLLGMCCMRRKKLCRRSATYDLTSIQIEPDSIPNDNVKTSCCISRFFSALFCCWCRCCKKGKKRGVNIAVIEEGGVVNQSVGCCGVREEERSCFYRFVYKPLHRCFCWTFYILSCCCCCWVDTVDQQIDEHVIEMTRNPDRVQIKKKKSSPPPSPTHSSSETGFTNDRHIPTRQRSTTPVIDLSPSSSNPLPGTSATSPFNRIPPENICALDSSSEETLFSMPIPQRVLHRQ